MFVTLCQFGATYVNIDRKTNGVNKKVESHRTSALMLLSLNWNTSIYVIFQ